MEEDECYNPCEMTLNCNSRHLQAYTLSLFPDGPSGLLDLLAIQSTVNHAGATSAWAQEFSRDTTHSSAAQLPAPGQEWAHDFAATQGGAQLTEESRDWAQEFTEPAGAAGEHETFPGFLFQP